MGALLECRHVTKIFGGGLFEQNRIIAVEDFSLAISNEPPSIIAVVGQSGSGKTTMARLFLGLETLTKGDVLYKGKPVSGLSGQGRREFLRDVQAVFQDPFGVYNPF